MLSLGCSVVRGHPEDFPLGCPRRRRRSGGLGPLRRGLASAAEVAGKRAPRHRRLRDQGQRAVSSDGCLKVLSRGARKNDPALRYPRGLERRGWWNDW